MTTPLARARETLDEIETLVAHLEDALGSELRLQSVSEDSAVRDVVAALLGRGEIEAWLTPAILKLAAHLLRVATLVALEADGVVPPRARDGGRALIDQVSRPGPQRPALFADHPALRWCLRLRADRLLIPAREELLACLAGLSLDVIPSLRAGLLALEPHLDGRIPPPDTPEVRAAALRHRNHLAALDQAACEVRALARTLGAHVRFFGSFARGRVHEHSDLDFLVLGQEGDARVEEALDEIDELSRRSPVPIEAVPQWFKPDFLAGSVP